MDAAMPESILIMFLNPANGLTSIETDIMRSYNVGRMICIPYSCAGRISADLESEFDNREVSCFDIDGPVDANLVLSIRDAMVAPRGKILIDVTFASSYHSAVCTNLGNSDLYEVYYSRCPAPGEIKHERVDRIRHDYRDLSETHYLVLGTLTMNPQMTEQIMNALDGKRSQSSVYAALNDLWDRGLIDKVGGKVPDGYISRIPNFFRFNPDQQWDYHVYIHLEKRRRAEMDAVNRKRIVAKQTKRDSLRSRRAPREGR